MTDQKRILEMLENGQLTSSEAMELLSALNDNAEKEQSTNPVVAHNDRRNYKYLKIRVTSDNNTVNVKVNIPIKLIKVMGGIATKMSSVIPKDAREELEDNGIDLSNIDFAEIVDEILNGTLDDPSIVDVETWDSEHNTTIKVKIYAE